MASIFVLVAFALKNLQSQCLLAVVPMDVMATLDPTDDKVMLTWQPPMVVIPIKYMVQWMNSAEI